MKRKLQKAKALPRKRKLTRKQMAVAIAKDVIAQIKCHKYTPESGTYVSGADDSIPTDAIGCKQLQPFLKKKDLQCEVCAIGATFLSSVRLFNDFVVPKYWDDSDMKNKLGEYFSPLELRALEASFENWGDSLFLDTPLFNFEAKNRMLFLMSEVIRQKGNFDPRKSIKFAQKL